MEEDEEEVLGSTGRTHGHGGCNMSVARGFFGPFIAVDANVRFITTRGYL